MNVRSGGLLAELGHRFEAMPYSRALGLQVEEMALDRVRLRVPYKDDNSNPGRILHGGVSASTIGIAGALAALTGAPCTDSVEASTLDLSVDYLAAAIGEDIVANATVLRRGKQIVYADVDVQNDLGKPVARGLVTYRAADSAARPGAPERQRGLAAADLISEPAAAGSEEVPALAQAITSVPFMARLGLRITRMRDGHARVRMPEQAENGDDTGAVHEGAVAALIDTAGAMASWSVTGIDFAYKASTVGIHVSYHAPARGEDVVACARTLRRNDEIFWNQVAVAGGRSGGLIATGSVTYRLVVPVNAVPDA